MPTIATCNIGPDTISCPFAYDATQTPANAKFDSTQSYTGPTLTLGTAAGQANLFYSTQLNIAASGNTNLNLQSLTDVYGNTMNFARVKSIYIGNASAASSISIGNAATNPWLGIISVNTATETIRANTVSYHGCCNDATGWVVNATSNQIKILNNDGATAALVNVLISGANA